ncbi:MAG: DUF2975 domain-containing protein [Clostridia bacterium]|nr:DUF2975 domain-containing protein [Clostridia bacterium]
MPKIPSKASVIISIILAVMFGGIVVGLGVFLPFEMAHPGPTEDFVRVLLADKLGDAYVLWFMLWCYAILAVALACCIAVTFLLLRVRKGLVFTPKSVSYIRFISWMCVLLAAIVLVAQYFHAAAFIIALAMSFLGLSLRVVKNVIEAATEIKNENDLTV